MATWTAMDNLATGDLVTEADMDAIRGNIEYLLDPNADAILYNNTADYTTTSATMVDVDATNLSITITTNGGPVLVTFSGAAQHNLARSTGFDVAVDGTAQGATFTYGINMVTTNANTLNLYMPVSFAILITGLSAASHTFKLQWNTGGATAKLASQAAYIGVNFNAIEL